MASVEQLRREIETNSQTIKRLAEQGRATPEEAEEVREAARSTTARMIQTPGRLGLTSPQERARTRVGVQELGAVGQFAAEAAPSTIGAIGGGAIGSLLGPLGTVGGAMLGGTAGELFGQETGVTPESGLGLAIAGGAPLAGPVAGAALRGVRRGIGAAAGTLPAFRQAGGELAKQEAESIVETMGANLFARQQGLVSQSADDLFDVLKRSDPAAHWNIVPGSEFGNVKKAAEALPEQFEPIRQLFAGRIPVSFKEIAATRAALQETAVRGTEAEKAAARGVFQALEKDIDGILTTTRPQQGMARQAKAAIGRVRMEFAIQDLDQAAMKFAKPVPGSTDAIELNVPGFRKWLLDKTSPRSAKYDKKLTEALGPIHEELNKSLARLEERIVKGKPGGPGSLVIQGRMAAGGAMVGSALLGPVGAGAGAIASTSVPRMFVRALASPRGRRVMESMVRLGKGNIPVQRWTALMEVTAQGLQSAERQVFEDER